MIGRYHAWPCWFYIGSEANEGGYVACQLSPQTRQLV